MPTTPSKSNPTFDFVKSCLEVIYPDPTDPLRAEAKQYADSLSCTGEDKFKAVLVYTDALRQVKQASAATFTTFASPFKQSPYIPQYCCFVKVATLIRHVGH